MLTVQEVLECNSGQTPYTGVQTLILQCYLQLLTTNLDPKDHHIPLRSVDTQQL